MNIRQLKRYGILPLLFFAYAIPVLAEKREFIADSFDCQLNNYDDHAYNQYVYLGKNISKIHQVVKQISELDDNKKSCLWALRQYIDKGSLFGEWDAVAQVLDYAELVLKNNYKKLPKKNLKKLVCDLELVISQMINGSLCIEPEAVKYNNNNLLSSQCCPEGLNSTVTIFDDTFFEKKVRIDDTLVVKGKTRLHDKLKVYDEALFKGEVTFENKVTFEDGVDISSLTVTDLVVLSCVDSLCVNTLTVTDIVSPAGSCIDICVNALTVTDLVVLSCMDNLCVNDLSAVDASVSGTLSVNNAYIDHLSIGDVVISSCLDSLCVNDLSAVDAAVSGTLSANNAYIDHLSIGDVVISSCIDELCVINLSAVDVSISNTLSVNNIAAESLEVCDISVNCNLIMRNTQVNSPGIGIIYKEDDLFIHNFGINNTFTGVNAGNLTMSGFGGNSGYGVKILRLVIKH